MGLVIKDEDMVRSSRENRQREEKRAPDGASRNSKSKGSSGGRELVEECVVSVEKTCIGIRQLWPYISGQVIIPLGALVSSSSMGHY